MAKINPKQLLQAAMASGGSGAAPTDSVPNLGAASAAGGMPAGPEGGLQDALPSAMAGAQPTGAENSGVLSTQQLGQQMGVGAEAPQDVQEAIAGIQSPQVPPDVKAQLQQQLQLAALRSLTTGTGGPQG